MKTLCWHEQSARWGVYSEIYPHDITVEELKALPNVKGIIINGGPNNVIDGVAIDVNPGIYRLESLLWQPATTRLSAK